MQCTISEAAPILRIKNFVEKIRSLYYREVMLVTLYEIDHFIPDCIEIVKNSSSINAAQDNILILQRSCLNVINTTQVTIDGKLQYINLSSIHGKANEIFTDIAIMILESVEK